MDKKARGVCYICSNPAITKRASLCERCKRLKEDKGWPLWRIKGYIQQLANHKAGQPFKPAINSSTKKSKKQTVVLVTESEQRIINARVDDLYLQRMWLPKGNPLAARYFKGCCY